MVKTAFGYFMAFTLLIAALAGYADHAG